MLFGRECHKRMPVHNINNKKVGYVCIVPPTTALTIVGDSVRKSIT